MKLVEMKCKNCGAILSVDEEQQDAKYQFCNAVFKIDDEVKRIKYEDMELSGYEFEKGRLKAQQEYSPNSSPKSVVYVETKKKQNGCLMIIAWLFLFPFTVTYYIAKSKKMDTKHKVIVIIALWIFFIILSLFNESDENIPTQDDSFSIQYSESVSV